MTKIFRNRVFVALICSILAVALIFAYTGSVKSEAQKVQIVRTKTSIAKGTKITKDMVETITAGGYNLPAGTVKSMDTAVGKYAATDLVANEDLMTAKISDTMLSANDRLSQLDGSKVAFSITIKDFSDGVSDKLMSGDIISVIVNEKGKKIEIPVELTYVEVLATTTAKGADRQDTKKSDEQQDNLKTATLLVTPQQALLLTDYEDNAEMHLALVYRGDKATAQKFLDKQNGVLNHG